MQNPRVQRMMNKSRHTKDGKVMLNILKYDIYFVVKNIGFIGQENACEFFKYVVDLLSEDKGKKSKSSKKSLPVGESEAPAKVDDETTAGQERKELL